MDWRDIPSLQALRGFEAAARCGSYTGAARELNVTHAAIAQHVRKLESHFGRPLMIRQGAGMVPTDAGAQLARSLSEGFATIGAGVRDLIERDATKPLRIALTPSLAANWLMPRIGDFWAAHPGIELELVPSPDLVDLRTQDYDLAIRYGRGPWPGVQDDWLMNAAQVVVARTGTVDGPVETLADLADATWLAETNMSEDAAWAAQHGLPLDHVRIREFTTITMVLEAIRAGHGVGIVPRVIALDAIARGDLQVVFEGSGTDLGYHLLTRKDRTSPALKALIGWLKKMARAEIAETPELLGGEKQATRP